ncbi:MAG: glycosyl transferase family 1 [Legionellales bacterium]|nr:glycosyl transferase family 1 [Legionellales bacterium]
MKILIIKLGALGDIIISTSVVNKIIAHHKKDEVYLLTTPSFTNIFNTIKSLKVIPIKRHGFFNLVRTILWIRKCGFKKIYDLQSNDRSTLYCALSGVPFRAGNHPRFPYTAHPDKKYRGECHSFERLNQIIISAGIAPAQPVPLLSSPPNTISTITRWLKEKKLAQADFIIMHAGSSNKHLQKRWPYFKELALILKNYFEIVWVGGPDDYELNTHLTKSSGINATGDFDVLSLAELGRRSKFAVTNDSAPMHILSCSKIPVFGIFGPTYPRRTHALGQIQNVIYPDNMPNNDDEFKPKNISKVTVDDVISKIKKQNLI